MLSPRLCCNRRRLCCLLTWVLVWARLGTAGPWCVTWWRYGCIAVRRAMLTISGRQWLRALLAATCIRGCLQPRVLSRPVTPHTSSVWPRNVCTLSSLCKASRVASSHLGFNESVSLIRKEKACVTCERQLNRASVATAHLLPCISTAAGDVSCRANSVALLSILRRTRCWAGEGTREARYEFWDEGAC